MHCRACGADQIFAKGKQELRNRDNQKFLGEKVKVAISQKVIYFLVKVMTNN